MTKEANSFYNVVLVEGPADEVKVIVDDLKTHFPGTVKESSEEAQRHRDWFAKEVGGFSQPLLADHITSAYRFQSEGAKPVVLLPPVMELVREVMERYKERAVIGYIAIDRQNAEWATAVGFSSDSPNGIVGSLGGDRFNYFSIQRHLLCNDDEDAWFRDVTTNKAVGPNPYSHRAQWSESSSPLRLAFRTEDPARDGWGMTQGSDSTERTFITENGFLPAVGVSVSSQVNWVTAIKLLLRGSDCEIYPYVDPDGQLMMSGYALRAADLIDPALTPTCELDQADLGEYRLGDPPSEEFAMVAVLKLYVHCLAEAREDFMKKPGTTELLARIQDHMRGAFRWLFENGHIKPAFVQRGSSSVN